jgi:hypothetical protein
MRPIEPTRVVSLVVMSGYIAHALLVDNLIYFYLIFLELFCFDCGRFNFGIVDNCRPLSRRRHV